MDKKGYTLSILIVSMMVICCYQLQGVESEGPTRGAADAYIAGIVKNGTEGMDIAIRTLDNTTEPPEFRYFNTTTTTGGEFNSTVDSDPTILAPYEVEVFRTYHKEMVKSFYAFNRSIESGETMTVPNGELEAVDAPTGDLEVKILNGSSGEPLSGVEVIVDHFQELPEIPNSVNTTNGTGSVLFEDLLPENTSVEATLDNFRDLSSTQPENWVVIEEGRRTTISFQLKEKPWPYDTDPSNGETGVNVSRNIVVDFRRVMNKASVENTDNYRLYREEDGFNLSFEARMNQDGDAVRLDPLNDLDHNTTYVLRIDTGIKTSVGSKPLWRAMTVRFTTEFPLPVISGRLVDNMDHTPVEGVEITLFDRRIVSNSSGEFHFGNVLPGTYSLSVEESFLYDEFSETGIELDRGDVYDMGDVELDRLPWGSLNVTVRSDYGPVLNAWVSIKDSAYNLTTNSKGSVSFSPVRADRLTLTAGAPHHSGIMEQSIVEENKTSFLTINLIEDPLPVSVEPTKLISPGIVKPSTLFNISFTEAVKQNTLDVVISELDDEGDPSRELDLLPITIGGVNKYVVKTISDLPLESEFMLLINRSLLTQEDEELLWRSYGYRFSTPEVPDSKVNGIILLEGRPYPDLTFTLNGEEYGVNEEGIFNVTVDMDALELDLVLKVDGSSLGYEVLYHNFSVDSGADIDLGSLSLSPIQGLFSVTPGNGEASVDPGTDVVLEFRDPIASDESQLPELIELIPADAQAPLTGTYSLENGSRRVVFTPSNRLEEGRSYIVRISSDLAFQGGDMVLPVGKESSFTVRKKAVEIDLISPDSDKLNDLPLDGTLRFSFGVALNKTYLEESMDIDPFPLRRSIVWHSASEASLRMFLEEGVFYTLTIPSGVYGREGEVLPDHYSLDLYSGGGYGGQYFESSFSIEPPLEDEMSPGGELRFNGIIENGSGMEAVVSITGDGVDRTHTSTVGEDGSWQIIFDLPNTTGSLEVKFHFGIPGQEPVDERSWNIDIMQAEDEPDQDGEDNSVMLIAIIIGIVALAVAVVIFIYINRKRREEPEAEDIEYDEVDIEMEE